jgi:hypothetical protein
MIWAFFSRRLRLWLLFALGVPVLRRALSGVVGALEERNGDSPLTRSIRTGNEHLARYDRSARREARQAPDSPTRR